jgi:hypothetical protein
MIMLASYSSQSVQDPSHNLSGVLAQQFGLWKLRTLGARLSKPKIETISIPG